jgi:hypothetical protein
MLSHSLRAYCKAPAGLRASGSTWTGWRGLPECPTGLRKASGVSDRFAYGFRTELHFAYVELVNLNTSDSVNSFNYAMSPFPHKCLPIELVPCSDGWC